jgi:hypothetical protein
MTLTSMSYFVGCPSVYICLRLKSRLGCSYLFWAEIPYKGCLAQCILLGHRVSPLQPATVLFLLPSVINKRLGRDTLRPFNYSVSLKFSSTDFSAHQCTLSAVIISVTFLFPLLIGILLR